MPFLAILILLSGAAPLVAQQNTLKYPSDTANVRQLALERFSLDLWHRVSAKAPDGNLLFSPASLTMALSMTYGGATGITAEAFARTLGIPGDRREAYESAASAWLAYVGTQKSVEFSMANSLWASQSVALLPDYQARMKAMYRAELARVDLSSRRSVELINGWVSRETRGKIPTMFNDPPLEVDSGMVLLNALYFKGKWTTTFDSSATSARSFHLPNGRTVQRPTMTQTGTFGYLRGAGYQGLRLPYTDGRFAMYVLLPASSEAVASLKVLSNSPAWAASLGGYHPTKVRVFLPRFTVRSSFDLNAPLKGAGLEVAFDQNRAEFYRMVSAAEGIRAWIKQVSQKTMMQVSEQGTEAAAATSVTMPVTAMAEPPPIDFVVDRPFAVVLRDEVSGMFLFVARIVDPE